MAITVTKFNTTITKLGESGWVRVAYDTGEVDGEGNPVVLYATITQAAIEKSAGVLLPKAQIKAIVQAALNATEPIAETNLMGAL